MIDPKGGLDAGFDVAASEAPLQESDWAPP